MRAIVAVATAVPTSATLPYPGFATDLQAQTMVLLSLAQGKSIVTENVFENRFVFVDELVRLGAEIKVSGHHAVVTGGRALTGATVRCSDLRAGAALVLAGLAAEGVTEVRDISPHRQRLRELRREAPSSRSRSRAHRHLTPSWPSWREEQVESVPPPRRRHDLKDKPYILLPCEDVAVPPGGLSSALVRPSRSAWQRTLLSPS